MWFGFRLKHNTVHAVQSLLSDCYEGLEAQNEVNFRSYDMSKAFDTVAHCVWIDKLYFYSFKKWL